MANKSDRQPDWASGIPLCDKDCPCVAGVGPDGGIAGGVCWPDDGTMDGTVRWGLPCPLEVRALVEQLQEKQSRRSVEIFVDPVTGEKTYIRKDREE